MVERFATLPVGSHGPEGLAADKAGNLYATEFDPTGTKPGHMDVFDNRGNFLRRVEVANSSGALLGLDFHPKSGVLLVLDFGAGNVLSVDPVSGKSSVFASTGAQGLNALTFDKEGNVYVSDSFQGIIWKTGPTGGALTAWATDTKDEPVLHAQGVPPFGANGVGFNKAFDTLFVANTGNDTVVSVPAAGGVVGLANVLTNSINGADGLILDEQDNIWVCANQGDEIVVIDKTGKVISKLGDFGGIDRDGAPIGFLFPASLVRHGGFIYVTNLSLDLRPVVNAQAVDSQWAAQVTTNTISRIRARILPNPD
ncbi:MAG TPA: SMP-30/gluconolactonase/LRE family protein [Gemmatimonadaceae bacterium]|nr:SMP-30/gluconolactonase/LRE family protein [Gemmatimonadaceae bacterium]